MGHTTENGEKKGDNEEKTHFWRDFWKKMDSLRLNEEKRKERGASRPAGPLN